MSQVSIAKKSFIKNGKPYFLLSGEIHYFRLKPSLWKKHLRMLKESGANTTSTYIPWDWHEYEENTFDFTGLTHPSRNLIKYIELCKTIGLDLIVKPGPYILAEYENQGLPKWLLKKLSKNAFALDESGNKISEDLVSYLSDEFLSYVDKWYHRVMPLIAKYQAANDGPITMMQICNEVGVFQWLSGRVDYNPGVIELFHEFIKKKYGSIESLNAVYTTGYQSFADYKIPTGRIETKQDYCAYFDFHLFFRHYYNLYLTKLKDKIKSYGISTIFTHNIPGWIYGQASELPMLISTYSEIFKNHPDIIFGLDHIPEFFSFRNAHSDLACNKILEAYQPDAPVWAAEFQAGSREHHVRAYANDLKSFYIASLAHGMRGFNYYMFSQGINPEGKGFYGKTFYYQTALSHKAEKLELYDVIKNVNNFINKEYKHLLVSETQADICIGLYKPYFYTEVISSQLLKEIKLNVEKLGLFIDPRFLREEILFNGAMRALQTLNYSYDVADLQEARLDNLLKYKQLWVLSTEYMDAETQELLVQYVKEGGSLVLYPAVPFKDLYLNDCTILNKNFDINLSYEYSNNKVEILNIKDTFTFYRRKQIFSGKGVEIIARTEDNKACGIKKSFGKGSMLLIGCAFGYSSSEHLEVFDKLAGMGGIQKSLNTNNVNINFVERKATKYKYRFFLNYHNEAQSLRYEGKKITIAPLSFKVFIKK